MAPILETKNLTHIYSEDTPFETSAIENINFRVEPGEFIGIIGHTGSGKSTLIQHLNGLLKPSAGTVYFSGEDIWAQKERAVQVRHRVGLVFQYPEYQLFEETVFKDISFGPKNMGLPQEEIEERVRQSAGFVGLDESVLDKSPFDLSGGQKRRAAIAGVIAMRPDVLILDEPTAGLDPRGRESIMNNIRAYHEAYRSAVVMVSHSMEEIADSVSQIYVMNRGGMAMSGSPQEVFQRAAELKSIGLSVPEMTNLFLRLREMGLDVDTSVYNVKQAVQAIARLTGGGRNA